MDPRKDDLEIKKRVGYVAEAQRMYDWMTVSQLIWFVSGFYPTWDAQYAQELLRDLEYFVAVDRHRRRGSSGKW